MTLAARIWALVLVLLAALAASNLMQAIERKDELMREKLLETRHLVETAYSVLAHYHGLQQQGKLSEAAARSAAIAAVKAMRYQGTDYFWLNDFSTPYPKMVMHPALPALDGQVLDAERFNCATSTQVGIDGPVVTTDGRKNLFVAFNEVANQGGQGYVTYQWPKPKADGGTTEATYPKLSFVKKFAPWDWLIGSGIYIDDVDAVFRREMWETALAIVPVAAVLLVALAILHSILSPVGRLAAAAGRIGAGDFRTRVSEEAGDPPELSAAMGAFNAMAGNLDSLMRALAEQQSVLEDRVRERTAELSTANAALTEEKAAQQALIRKLETAQNQLLQAEKMAAIGQLAAGVAHEINNPIGFVNSNLRTLQSYIDDLQAILRAFEERLAELPEPDRQALEQVKKDLDLDFLRQDIGNLLAESLEGLGRVKRIVQDLKDFSHVDASERLCANLEKGLDSTLNVVWNEIKYKAQVVKEYAGIPEIECFPGQLNQVFMNLLINAAQAIDGAGVITLRTGADDGHVWVEVEDSGHGISPEHLPRLFEPFFTTKDVGKGTGLGLSLSYGIVKKHGGRIDVRSEPGKGSVFRVTLPKELPPGAGGGENRPAAAQIGPSPV